MKAISRILGALVLSSFGSAVCQADGVVIRAKDAASISAIVASYPQILAYDQAGSSPFARFEVAHQNVDSLENILSGDTRVVWAEDEDGFSSPENQSSHGSTVAAIYDRQLSFSENNTLWTQINFAAMPINTKTSVPLVGIVDTGVSHLQPSILSRVVAGSSFVNGFTGIDDFPTNLDSNGDGIYDDGTGHGTMIAGLILQLCPEARLVIAKSADSDGNATSWSVLKGVVFCIEKKARYINVSLGSQRELPGFGDFMDWVEAMGVVVIAPAGNNGQNITLFPAAYGKVLSTTGLMPDNTKASFSNWNTNIRIATPATGIRSAWWDGGTAVWSGTSFCAPLVTGCLAVANPFSLTKRPGDIRRAVFDSGFNIDQYNPLYQGKIGRLLDFQAFVRKLKSG